jgi:hypothetical protein
MRTDYLLLASFAPSVAVVSFCRIRRCRLASRNVIYTAQRNMAAVPCPRPPLWPHCLVWRPACARHRWPVFQGQTRNGHGHRRLGQQRGRCLPPNHVLQARACHRLSLGYASGRTSGIILLCGGYVRITSQISPETAAISQRSA